MIKIYIDDSVHERGDFIISGIVITKKEVEEKIIESLIKHGFNPEVDEFKSGLNYRKYPKMLDVRNDLKGIISSNCQIGLVLLPLEQRQNIGIETLKGLKKILDSNDFGEDIEIYFDDNYFKNRKTGEELGRQIGFDNYRLILEVDSIKIKGIQLADLVAHTFATMLLEQLGLIDKKVKAGENSGYDPDLEIELGFELWATIRYNIIGEIDMEKFDNGDGHPIKITEPFGFYISSFCDENLRKNGKERFGEMYLGCIH